MRQGNTRQDGDTITIDTPGRRLRLEVPEEQLRRRLARWQRPEPKFRKGYLSRYARPAESADKGATIRHRAG